MPQSYPVHPDYARAPVFNLRFGRFTIALVNSLMKVHRRFAVGKPPSGIARDKARLETTTGTTPALLIRPAALPASAPVLLYFHGGAFAMTYGSLHIQMCQRYALTAQCLVVLVDYRLAPRNPWPAGFDDCYDSLLWVLRRAQDLGVDTSRIVVGGDSAGGALAAGVAQKARDNGIPVAGQMLLYPVTDSTCETVSAREFHDTPIWNGISNRRMWRAYLGAGNPLQPPDYAAPGLRQNLDGLPPAYVETAQFDPLRDEGADYAQRLETAGVALDLNETRGTIHGYDFAQDNPLVIQALEQRVAFLRNRFTTAA